MLPFVDTKDVFKEHLDILTENKQWQHMHNHLNIISFHNSSEPSYWQYQRLINKTVNVKKDVFFSDR